MVRLLRSSEGRRTLAAVDRHPDFPDTVEGSVEAGVWLDHPPPLRPPRPRHFHRRALGEEGGRLYRRSDGHWLVEVGDEVCELVLADNFGQALSLSLDSARSRRDIWSFQHAMMWLRERQGFSRYTEHLPANADVVKKRKEQGKGFFRPELSKLSSYTKMVLARSVINDPPGAREDMLPFMRAYCPWPARIAATAASRANSGPSKSGNPCDRLIAP